MKKFKPIEAFSCFFESYKGFTLKICFTYSITCFCVVGSDTRATS